MDVYHKHNEEDHTKDPAQEDPDPAVHPKQCSPVTIRRRLKSESLKDLMWSGAP
jgi:hypothetical protein